MIRGWNGKLVGNQNAGHIYPRNVISKCNWRANMISD